MAVHGPRGHDQTGIKMLPQESPRREGCAPGRDGKDASIGWSTSQEPGASPCTPSPPKSSPGEGGEGENPELPDLKFLEFYHEAAKLLFTAIRRNGGLKKTKLKEKI